jgi:serine/threonine protein kinase
MSGVNFPNPSNYQSQPKQKQAEATNNKLSAIGKSADSSEDAAASRAKLEALQVYLAPPNGKAKDGMLRLVHTSHATKDMKFKTAWGLKPYLLRSGWKTDTRRGLAAVMTRAGVDAKIIEKFYQVKSDYKDNALSAKDAANFIAEALKKQNPEPVENPQSLLQGTPPQSLLQGNREVDNSKLPDENEGTSAHLLGSETDSDPQTLLRGNREVDDSALLDGDEGMFGHLSVGDSDSLFGGLPGIGTDSVRDETEVDVVWQPAQLAERIIDVAELGVKQFENRNAMLAERYENPPEGEIKLGKGQYGQVNKMVDKASRQSIALKLLPDNDLADFDCGNVAGRTGWLGRLKNARFDKFGERGLGNWGELAASRFAGNKGTISGLITPQTYYFEVLSAGSQKGKIDEVPSNRLKRYLNDPNRAKERLRLVAQRAPLVSGQPLNKNLKNLSAKKQVARELVDVLQKMAQRGFVHRDIKPDNILYDAESQAVGSKCALIDVGGLAKFAKADETDSPIVVGSPVYMHPAVVAARLQVDVSVEDDPSWLQSVRYGSDLYSLGMTLLDDSSEIKESPTGILGIACGELLKGEGQQPGANDFRTRLLATKSGVEYLTVLCDYVISKGNPATTSRMQQLRDGMQQENSLEQYVAAIVDVAIFTKSGSGIEGRAAWSAALEPLKEHAFLAP